MTIRNKILISLCLCSTLCLVTSGVQARSKYLSQENIQKRQQVLEAQKKAARIPIATVNVNSDTKILDNSGKTSLTIRDHAFKELLEKTMPLTPKQIRTLRKQKDASQRAAAATPSVPPKPVATTLPVDLSPGVTPPVIRLSAGFVTSLVFIDATGEPWPVVDYSLGNPDTFNMQWDKKTNTLFVQSTNTYAAGNLAIRLKDLNTPIMLSLVSGQRNVDYRVDLRVQGRGPNALAAVTSNDYGNNMPPELISVLDGIAPQNGKELQVSNNMGRAWLHNDNLIFRTKFTLLSPAWSTVVSSPDGTKVYSLTPTPLILAMLDGRPTKIHITGL